MVISTGKFHLWKASGEYVGTLSAGELVALAQVRGELGVQDWEKVYKVTPQYGLKKPAKQELSAEEKLLQAIFKQEGAQCQGSAESSTSKSVGCWTKLVMWLTRGLRRAG